MADLKNLLEITFVDSDQSVIEQRMIASYEAKTGKKLYPGDPSRLFLTAQSVIFSQLYADMDYTAKQNLLFYAEDDPLDHLAAMTETVRLDPDAAIATLRYEIDAALAFAVPVAKGVRATPDGALMFATSAYAEIPAGSLYVDVQAVCLTTGTGGNDLVAGQISRMVDTVPHVARVGNITTSAGGADKEDNDSLRERAHLAPERFSVAGPPGAYEYFAKSAHQSISDVRVYMPDDGQVSVRVLCEGGTLPDTEILAAVEDAVADERNRRPLTDQVLVSAPDVVSFDATLTYYIDRADQALAVEIQAAVDAAVAEYVLWQRSKIGRDINPDDLVGRIRSAGAKRTVLTAPVFTALEKWEVAQEGTVTVTYGGLEDE